MDASRSAEAERRAKLIFSLPGEWIDRRGRPQPRTELHRILVIKPDHIGDLLIGSQAFALLRRFFPNARIELVCGPWNVTLARKFDLFDEVHGVTLFHESSEEQSNGDIARTIKRTGVTALSALQLGPFDLAIDMRYDKDSRSVLPTVDARIYAGFGTSSEFPFLDIALPLHEPIEPELPYREVVLSRRQFHRGATPVDGVQIQGINTIGPEKLFIELNFTVIGARSPASCGTMLTDNRILGVGFEGALVSGVADEHASVHWSSMRTADVRHISGWDNPESWGCWALGAQARLAVLLPDNLETPFVAIALVLRAHLNTANPLVECTVRTPDGAVSETRRFTYPAFNGVLTLVVPRKSTRNTLASEPFRLSPGTYQGTLRMYFPAEIEAGMDLEVQVDSLETSVTLLHRGFGAASLRRGLCDLPLELVNDLAEEQLVFSVDTTQASAFAGSTVEFLSLRCIAPRKVNAPVAHMEHWASLLVLRVAQMFSRESPFDAEQDLPMLAFSGAGQDRHQTAVQDLISRIQEWRFSGHSVVAIALGCNSAIRTWPLHYFIELARSLLQMGPIKLAFIGGMDDHEVASTACAALKLDSRLHSFCGAVTLEELGSVLRACDLFIGNNTGTTHYAGKVGVRTIGIYSGTNHPAEWGPVGPNSSWIYRDEPCAPCFLTDLRACRHGHACLNNLLPGDVLAVIAPELEAICAGRQRAPLSAE
jgi:ADP-heptose:LPS heptosyltransferase